MDMTRGEFARVLAIKLGLPLTGSTSGFSDTRGTSYDPYVAALKAAGIITGTTSSTFSPHMSVTREMVATMIGRAYDISSSSSSGFSDVASNHYAANFISGLRDAGIFNGVNPSTFGIGGTFTWDNWGTVSGRIDNWVGNTSTPTPREPVGTTRPPSGNQEPGSLSEDAFDWAEDYIDMEFDLPGMGTWVAEMVRKYGATLSPAILDIEIRKTNQFDERFGEVMRGREAAGLNAVSPAEILAYEDSVRQIMRASGMPAGMYDEISDIHKLLVNDLSPAELEERITLGFERVAYAPIEVRQAYADFYGVQGDEALAAFLLDPEVAIPALERMVVSSEIAGTGTQLDLSITRSRAEQLADRGIDQRMAFTGFSKLSALAPLFQETFGGGEQDITAEDEGIDSVLLGQGEQTRLLERRVATRQAEFSGGGGSMLTSDGFLGAGSAN